MTSRRRFLQAGLGHGAIMTLAAAQTWLGALPLARAQSVPDKVTLQLNWLKDSQHGGHFVAIEKGFFRDEGIDCEVIAGGPGVDSIGLVASGRAMLGDRDSSNVILARLKGIPIKGFAATYQRNPFSMVSLKAKPVKSLEEMVGKTVAIPTQRRGPLNAVLKRKGIDPATVNFVPTGGDASVLASGQVDAYFGWTTTEALVLQRRGVELYFVPVDELGDPSYAQVIFATDETLQTQSDLLLRWVRAEIKGWSWMADHPEETARMVVEKYGRSGLDLDGEIAKAKATGPYLRAPGERVLWIDSAIFESGKRLAIESGIKARDVPVADMFTQSLVRQAHG